MKKVFECQRCGFCCQGESTVSLSPEEISRISAFLGLSPPEFLRLFTLTKGRRVEMKTIEGHCIFYETSRRLCKIHPVKPKPCQEWPLHFSILKSRENFEIIKSSCPGFREDLSWEEIKEYLKNESFGGDH